MQVSVFKRKFLRLTTHQKKAAISEMEQADIIKNHCTGIPKAQHAEIVKAFHDLVDWCKTKVNA